jgi:hypothetical protein
LIDDCIDIACRCSLSEFDVGRWALGVRRSLPAFRGTSIIPHFGQLPGSFVTTSGCMTQVYCCADAGSAAQFAAKNAAMSRQRVVAFKVAIIRMNWFRIPEDHAAGCPAGLLRRGSELAAARYFAQQLRPMPQQAWPPQQLADPDVALALPTSARALMIINRYFMESSC